MTRPDTPRVAQEPCTREFHELLVKDELHAEMMLVDLRPWPKMYRGSPPHMVGECPRCGSSFTIEVSE